MNTNLLLLNVFFAGGLFTFLVQELKRRDYRTALMTFIIVAVNLGVSLPVLLK